MLRDRSGFDVVRYALHAPQVRMEATEDAEDGILHGHFSVFNRWYEIDSPWEGNFLERVAPGTFSKTFAEDVQRCWFEHGYDSTVGRMSLGSIQTLEEDSTGARYEVRLFDSVPGLLREGLAAGEYGASFRMRITGEEINADPGESEHNPRGLPEVTITEVRCPEFGPVSIGASPHATANLRCATDQFYERMRSADPDAYETARSAASLTDPVESAPGGAGGEGEETPTARPDTGRASVSRLIAAGISPWSHS